MTDPTLQPEDTDQVETEPPHAPPAEDTGDADAPDPEPTAG